eukprot:11234199-Alexandrium_andersonii.AAC.1
MWNAWYAGAQRSLHVEGSPLVLPREVVDAPRAHDQVASQSDQCCPVCCGGARHPPAELRMAQ